tara:strand:+ start:1273 stop:1641 length:369 start_codon:yes stop_codon:yes gene_type:complete
MNISLQLNQDPTGLVPGQVIDGVAEWDLEDAPKRAALRLFWYTDGRGTQDVGVVEELALPTTHRNGKGTFRFTIPTLPYSFQGQLITLKWAIELVFNKGKQVERLDLIVSPWVEQVKLQKVD